MIVAVDTKIKTYSPKIKAKRNSRAFAIQSLYAYDIWQNYGLNDSSQLIIDILDVNKVDVLNELEITPAQQFNKSYFVKIVKGTIKDLNLIDDKVALYISKDWKIERLPKLIKAILRVAIYELINTTEIGKVIIIDEYLEIAKLFNHDGEVGFINSVLDNFIKEQN